jgi:hypothetical protein
MPSYTRDPGLEFDESEQVQLNCHHRRCNTVAGRHGRHPDMP